MEWKTFKWLLHLLLTAFLAVLLLWPQMRNVDSEEDLVQVTRLLAQLFNSPLAPLPLEDSMQCDGNLTYVLVNSHKTLEDICVAVCNSFGDHQPQTILLGRVEMDELQEKLEELLKQIFYRIDGNAAAFSRNSKLVAAEARKLAPGYELDPAYITRQRVKDFLKAQQLNQLHRPVRKRFVRQPYFSPRINHIWVADTASLPGLAQSPEDPKYFLLVMDVLSRKLYAKLLKSITGARIVQAMEGFFIQADDRPAIIGSDRGTEFVNSTFEEMLNRHGIRFYSSYSAHKIAAIERAVQTVKTDLQRAVEGDPAERRYTELFDHVLDAYNNRPHDSLPAGISCPNAVTKQNQHLILEQIRDNRRKMYAKGYARFHFNLGDRVRISKDGGPFRKGFKVGWSRSPYVIIRRFATLPAKYMLKNYHTNEVVLGNFYKEELNLIPPDTDLSEKPYKVRQVIAHRKRAGRGEVMVKLRGPGADQRYAFWVDRDLVEELPQQRQHQPPEERSPQTESPPPQVQPMQSDAAPTGQQLPESPLQQQSPPPARRSQRVRKPKRVFDL